MTAPIGFRRTLLFVGAATLLATTVVAPPAAAAPSATAGLYGASDPTYDGVYRQSLALLGLAATGARPAPSAVTWLLDQQCADGSFQAYRADLTQPCATSDPVAFTGPDTNSTAMAVMALAAVEDARLARGATIDRAGTAAAKAAGWLRKQQRPDGGFTWSVAGASDASSTGLSMAALRSQARDADRTALRRATRFLATVAAPCAAGGGLATQPGSKVDAFSTTQGLLGLAGTLPVGGPRPLAVKAPCSTTVASKAVSNLSRDLVADGTLASVYGTGPDYASTATAVLGLVGSGRGRTAVAAATRALKSAAATITTGVDGAVPGSLGLLLMVSEATGAKPTSFGGVNLVTTLAGSIRR